MQPKHGLIRFVVGPDGRSCPDILGKLPGRGIWVSADRAALEKAVAKKLFARGAKQPVTVPEGLVGRGRAALVRRVVDLIALARKAGEAVAGYEKVKDWLDKEEARVLIQAADGSERGKSKLQHAAFRPLHRLPDGGRIGFGIRAPNCDTCARSPLADSRHVL